MKIGKLKVYLGMLAMAGSLSLVGPEEAYAKTYFYNSTVTMENDNEFKITSYSNVAHQIEKGETIKSIAKKYSTTVEELAELNGLTVSELNKLKTGDIITVIKSEKYRKSSDEITAKENKASLTFKIELGGQAYVKVNKNIKNEKKYFKSDKAYKNLEVGKEYKILGLNGRKVIDIANTTIDGKTDYYYLLLSDGTVVMLDLKVLYEHGIFQVTAPVEGFNKVSSLSVKKKNDKYTAYATINHDVTKKLPTKAKSLSINYAGYEVKKDYTKLTIDTIGSSVIQFGLTEKGEVVARLTENFGKDTNNFENLEVITQLQKGTNEYIYKVENIKGKVTDIASINSGTNRVSDFVFLLENGKIQLLDLDAFYKEGRLIATDYVKGYNDAMMFLPGEYYNNNQKLFAYVQILDEHNVKNITTFDQYKQLYRSYSR